MVYTLSVENREDVESLIQAIEDEGWRVADYSVRGDIQVNVQLDLIQK